MLRAGRAIVCALALSLSALACDQVPTPSVVLDNEYPADGGAPFVVYRAFWQAVAFQNPVPPGESSDAQSTLPASPQTAYAILAPGWDPSSDAGPTSFVILQSSAGFGVAEGETLHIRVGDATFVGNCASGSHLTQDQADFITKFVFTSTIFPDAAPPFRYVAATCTTLTP